MSRTVEKVDHKLARIRGLVWWALSDALGHIEEAARWLSERLNDRGHRALERACDRSEP